MFFKPVIDDFQFLSGRLKGNKKDANLTLYSSGYGVIPKVFIPKRSAEYTNLILHKGHPQLGLLLVNETAITTLYGFRVEGHDYTVGCKEGIYSLTPIKSPILVFFECYH